MKTGARVELNVINGDTVPFGVTVVVAVFELYGITVLAGFLVFVCDGEVEDVLVIRIDPDIVAELVDVLDCLLDTLGEELTVDVFDINIDAELV